MASVLATPTAPVDLKALKTKQQGAWSSGDYAVVGTSLQIVGEELCEALDLRAGQKVLDVAAGNGNATLAAARRFAEVTSTDYVPALLERGRQRATADGLSVMFREADAEALPFADGAFDAVLSTFGVMFTPDQEKAASELVRVCRRGGRIGLANWTPQGFIGQMFKTIAKHIAPSGMPSPVLWGDEATVRGRLKRGILDVKCTLRFAQFSYPFPPHVVVKFFRENYGPMAKAFASLDPEGQERLTRDLVELWTKHNRAEGAGTLVDSEFLEVIAVRETKRADIAEFRSPGLERKAQSRRAELLADRIEEGAARLAEFASQLTETEWRVAIAEGGKPGRTAGVIVHHVASVYPIEVQLAKTIASGQSVTDVTWDVVNALNARHVEEHANATKAETLELLKRNSAEAAAAVRELTDEQLDRAAPFSLSYGAPVTAQFVIEDHALRHSWHHLARLRRAFGTTNAYPHSELG